MPHIKINQPNVSIFGTTVEIDGETLHGVKSIDYHASVDDNETPVVTLGIRPKSGFELDAESGSIVEECFTVHDAVSVLQKAILENNEVRKAFIASILSAIEEYETKTEQRILYKPSIAEKILDRILGEGE